MRKRTQRSRATVVVACAAVVATLTGGLATAADGPAGDTFGRAEQGQGRGPIALITGDQVVLGADGAVTGLIRAEGREDVPVRVMEIDGATHVIPADVQQLIADGTLDRRLFNVTELSREQYRQRDGLGVIVTYAGERQADLLSAQDEAATTLEAVNGEALVVAENELAGLWNELTTPAEGEVTLAAAPEIESIALDGLVQASLDTSVPQIGAPDAWEAGYDGEGVTIAVLDTGISDDHEDVTPQVVAEQNFSESADTEDHFGHGTHVASIAAGTGAHSGGTYTGVAPGARLLDGKVLDDSGSGWDSGIIAGMEWAVEQGADIVNMSLGGWATEEVDPLEEAVDALSAQSDTLFVIAAGNDGPSENSIGTPGTAESALTVGAVDKQDQLADFSSVGGRLRDAAVKPDLTGPGVDIGAAAAPGSVIAQEGTPVADGYVAISGTSMATPHVAGAAAILAQAHPDWTGEQLKAALTASTQRADGYSPLQQGTGRVDVPAALAQSVVAETPSLTFGVVPFPHDDAEPITRELTYRNLGDADVTLDLTAEGLAPDGSPAPEGVFTLGADQVTVPAGATATVPVTASTAAGDQFGTYSLWVTATGGDQTVRTSGSVLREEEKFDLTIEVSDRSGQPAEAWETYVQGLDDFSEGAYLVPGEEGSASTRLPAGRYQLDTTVYYFEPDSGELTAADWLVQPSLELTEDTTLTVDAADARRISLTGPDYSAEEVGVGASFDLLTEDAGFGVGMGFGGLSGGLHTAQVGDVPDDWELSSSASSDLVNDDREYHLLDTREGSFYTGLRKRVSAYELARITTRQGASLPDREGVLVTSSDAGGAGSAISRSIPTTTEVYVQAAAGAWFQEFIQFDAEGNLETDHWSDFETYEPGESYETTFNVGVFGPAINEGQGLFLWGSTLLGIVNPFADGASHTGDSVFDSASTTLYRNGEEYATEDGNYVDWVSFELPPGEAEYELVTTASRSETGGNVSTEVTASYTFTAAPGGEEDIIDVPATAVRYTPELALDSTGPAGETVQVPVALQGSAADGNLESLTVSVSYDGGETWTETPVEDGTLTVTNPEAGGTVSFHAVAVDAQGNTTTQTIIDAYRTT
ncbi:S8 family peptidase [Streptomyces millisiae]|uniref:S8 family serine peptidase n=1 Tax=Streptomyces millisiae TaxID=3075542 RepID=A0ABU2LU97_9ACTN|nr:S8 family serine peptidase [Streptomyces sp. DSM 44918]MDT0321121.1 S8 family serine peptidase [Streptomyces sp. DSM 44918]